MNRASAKTRIASDDDWELDRKLDQNSEHEPRTVYPRQRNARLEATIRTARIGTRPGGVS